MHVCLQIPEIQRIIFAQYGDGHSRKTLAALARSCSDFYGTAMDALWWKLDAVGPLLHSLPSHLLCERSRPSWWSDYGEEIELVRVNLSFIRCAHVFQPVLQ